MEIHDEELDRKWISSIDLNGKASVVIVTYNSSNYLSKCLNSVLRNNPHEIIIVDNASTDDTCSVIEKEFSQVKLVRNQDNIGYGRACNIGVSFATGEYAIILNPDTFIREDCILNLIYPLQKESKIITTPKILLYDGSAINTCGNIEHFTGLTFTRGLDRDPDNYGEQEIISGVSGACFAMRRKDYLDLGGFDEGIFLYMDDAELSWRALINGFRILYIPSSIIYHDYDLRVSSKKIYLLEKGRYSILRKFYSNQDLIFIFPSLLVSEILTWGYSIRFGKAGIRAKFNGMIDGLRSNGREIKSNNLEFLKALDSTIPEHQLSFSKLDVATKKIANMIFRINIGFVIK